MKDIEKFALEKTESTRELMEAEEGEAESFTVSATGTDIKSVTQNLMETVSGTSSLTGASFDLKA